MLDEIKKSVNTSMYERTTGPFYGSFVISWLLWNWNIIYLTIFVSEKNLGTSKLEFINLNLINYWKLIWFPLISALMFSLVVPYFTNRIYVFTLKYKKWRIDQKLNIEMKQVLTLEQSILLRKEMVMQETSFHQLLESKNAEIEQLKSIISQTKPIDQKEVNVIGFKTFTEIANTINSNNYYKEDYNKILRCIQGSFRFQGIDTRLVSLLESNDIIMKKSNGTYDFTKTGIEFQRLMVK